MSTNYTTTAEQFPHPESVLGHMKEAGEFMADLLDLECCLATANAEFVQMESIIDYVRHDHLQSTVVWAMQEALELQTEAIRLAESCPLKRVRHRRSRKRAFDTCCSFGLRTPFADSLVEWILYDLCPEAAGAHSQASATPESAAGPKVGAL